MDLGRLDPAMSTQPRRAAALLCFPPPRPQPPSPSNLWCCRRNPEGPEGPEGMARPARPAGLESPESRESRGAGAQRACTARSSSAHFCLRAACDAADLRTSQHVSHVAASLTSFNRLLGGTSAASTITSAASFAVNKSRSHRGSPGRSSCWGNIADMRKHARRHRRQQVKPC